MSALGTGSQPLDSRGDQLARLAGALMRPLDQRGAASFIIGEVAALPAVAYASLSLRRGSGLVEVASLGPVPARAPASALAERATTSDFLTHASAEELDGEGLAVVRHHHERWDGQGYPDTLAEAAIPLGARILAVADALDAITSRHPYRPARTWDEAIAEIDAGAGRQFDPTIVGAFRKHERSLRRIHHQLVAA
jgi:hypothetical protein